MYLGGMDVVSCLVKEINSVNDKVSSSNTYHHSHILYSGIYYPVAILRKWGPGGTQAPGLYRLRQVYVHA